MGRKQLAYDDAVRLLGGECKVITALSKLAGATLTGLAVSGTPVVLSLFSLKDEVAHLSQDVIKVLRPRLIGIGRFKRSQLLEAAHAVLVVSAFFVALDDLDSELGTALNSASLELTNSERVALATSSEPSTNGMANLVHDLITPGRIPGLDAGVADQGCKLVDYYEALAANLRKFTSGTSAWDERNETIRSKWALALSSDLPKRALELYLGQLVQLAGKFPEFAFWANRIGIQVVLKQLTSAFEDSDKLGTTLQNAAKLLATAASGPNPEKIRVNLTARYRDQIAKPVTGAAAGNVPDEVKLPSLQELYVTPSYRMMPSGTGGIERITESSWAGISVNADLGAMIFEHLISTEAAYVPLVLLGQPGAGKSVFSQMLAAELDPRDYLVVRVELRAVPFDAGIQEQIEAAIADLTGQSIRWPALAEAAGNAQPVILLDGFDELLQASGVSHFDFLERVQAFQEREADLGRPVAVMVTSRTAVANQVRYPARTPIARLEEFDADQVGRWLSVWNQANPTRPLTPKNAVAQGDLARQPLLLFLLALFHSGGGDLTPGISQAHLFERLCSSFVERDVEKLDAHLTDKQRHHVVQRDLDNLSMTAFAMFNRGRQSVSDAELIADLTALQPEQGALTGPGGRAAALSIAERMAGRFFFRLFMHKDEAMRGQQTMLITYEFLHASFGEFLVGRWVVSELSRLAEQFRRTANDPYPSPPDDSKLYALLSMTVLSTREQRVLSFIRALLVEKRTDELTDLRKLAVRLFSASLRPRNHNPYPHYQVSAQTAPAAYAAYNANLVLLILLIAEAASIKSGKLSRAKVPVTELHAVSKSSLLPISALANFYKATRLWHAQLTRSEWRSLLEVVRIQPARSSAKRTAPQRMKYELSLGSSEDFDRPISGHQILYGGNAPSPNVDDYVERGSLTELTFREATLLGAIGYQGACTALLPYLGSLGSASGGDIFESTTLLSPVLALLIPTTTAANTQRSALYIEVLESGQPIHAARLVLGRLRDDTHHFAPTELGRIALAATPYAWTHISAYLDIVAQVGAVLDTKALDKLLAPLRIRRVPVRSRRTVPFEWGDVVNDVLGLTWRDLLVLLDPHYLVDPEERYGPRTGRPTLFQRLGIRDPADVVALMSLRDLLNLMDVRELAHLYNMPDSQNSPEDADWPGWGNSPIFQIALWAAMKQRGLPTLKPPAPLEIIQLERLEAIVPEFVSRTRQLAAECGFPKLLSVDA